MNCNRCGACCIAFDISTLNKPVGIACEHLMENGECNIYDTRPQVCRSFKPDEICELIAPLPLQEKIRRLKEIYL